MRKTSQDFPSAIIGLYLDMSPGVLKELETAALAGDTAVLRTANHRLLATSVAVGAVRLVGMSHKLDEIVRSGGVPDAVERVPLLRRNTWKSKPLYGLWTAAQYGGPA